MFIKKIKSFKKIITKYKQFPLNYKNNKEIIFLKNKI